MVRKRTSHQDIYQIRILFVSKIKREGLGFEIFSCFIRI